ncbi:acyl carrier protein [Alkalimonas collagenimarina]|uniref:Acyl carrier protein n=1 Tax=Alkalimonas collagenimarina TaxID=400390 RepID=A0ABT9GWX7_9GAMM|nr:acyl carrier protein [Alkalimonas collagenimarina]MDP4535567.1 acyl carrier protein [Alkalimonas collagenimarina]
MSNAATSSARTLVIGFIEEMNRSSLRGDEIQNNFELKDKLNIDSLNKLILLTRVTEHLGIEFGTADKTINDFTSVNDLISFVESHITAPEAS